MFTHVEPFASLDVVLMVRGPTTNMLRHQYNAPRQSSKQSPSPYPPGVVGVRFNYEGLWSRAEPSPRHRWFQIPLS
ncbi:MAG: hypothetical protein HIU84_01555 [Acidobacteria bacterium]|nr:hypothetical protein [Acidobacteriota bacterium]